MRKIISFLVIGIMLIAVVNTLKADDCWDGICFPDGERSFADSVVSYNPGTGAASPNTTPSAALGPPDYDDDGYFDGCAATLGYYGVLVVQFTDNSLTTSGSTDDDLWIFEIGAEVESTSIDISTDGVNWIQVGATSGSTSGVDIDAYIGYGVVLGERYSYVRITDDGTNDYTPTYGDGGPDIDAVGAIESADPVSTTTTTEQDTTTTTTMPDTITTTTPEDTTTTTIPEDTTTSTIISTTTSCDPNTQEVCGDICCDRGWRFCCNDEECCSKELSCSRFFGCVAPGSIYTCLGDSLYGEYSEEAELLRAFRDEVLSQTPIGREITKLYYEWSPVIVKAMEEDEEFRKEVKEMVDGVLEMVVETE